MRTRSVTVGRLNPLLALLGLLGFVAADLVGLFPLAFAALPLGLLLVLVPVRWWRARRGQLEFGLLRRPLRRELRPYLLQAGNHWLFWGLFAAVAIVTPTFTLLTGPPGLRLSAGGHRAFTVLLVVAAVVDGGLGAAAPATDLPGHQPPGRDRLEFPGRPAGGNQPAPERPGRHRLAAGRGVVCASTAVAATSSTPTIQAVTSPHRAGTGRRP